MGLEYTNVNAALTFLIGDNLTAGGGWIYNKHSKELSFFLDGGIGIEVATPKLMSLGASGGILIPYGYSSNDMLLGDSIEAGGELGADCFGELGLDVGRSWEVSLVQNSAVPAYDPESGEQPYTDHIGLSGGFNVFPNGVDVSATLGLSETYFVVTVPFPW